MKRSIMSSLIQWKHSKRRKPLILRGSRQVGKTTCMKDFAEKNYDNHVYISFDKDEFKDEYFINGLSPSNIVKNIEILKNIKIEKEKTLIIFDEIQDSIEALKSLKYFNEEDNAYHIMAAGSFLGVMHKSENASFPVGKVNFLNMYPMNFLEFLDALGYERYTTLIRTQNFDLLKIISKDLNKLLREYFIIGGMPEVVYSYITNKNFEEVKTIQAEIIDSYLNDFSKHAEAMLTSKIKSVFLGVPLQLAKERKKFVYSDIDKKARARTHEDAIDWLVNAGLVIKVKRTSKIDKPLKFYYDEAAFKLFLLDVGLLSYQLQVSEKAMFKDREMFVEFKGALAEQYVIQQLHNGNDNIGYWSNESSKTEIDFVYDYENNIIPIEIKSGFNLKAKSLVSYIGKYKPNIAIRSSLVNYSKKGELVDLPLYSIGELEKIIDNILSKIEENK